MIKKRDSKGFTLIELAICILVIGIISAIAAPRITSMFEDADAEVFRAVGGQVELAISQGLSRGKTLTELNTGGAGFLDEITDMVASEQSGNIDIPTPGAGTFTATAKSSKRTATYSITTDARVVVDSITGFNQYTVVNGDIVK